MWLGAHESVAQSLHLAVSRGLEDGCEAIQIFVKNQRTWTQRPHTDAEIGAFRDAYASSGLKGLMAHGSYLINLCSTNPQTMAKSVEALRDELTRCAQLGVPHLVLHPGSHMGAGEDAGLAMILANLATVYEAEQGHAWAGVTLLFENTAGQGTNLGWSLDHLEALIKQAPEPERVGVCIDTCHAHAAGYDLTTDASYASFWSQFDAQVGLSKLGAFHLNDSKQGLGSRVDRHEHIGEGTIGLSAFARLVNDARFARVPAALETPPLSKDEMSYKKNLATLRGLIV